MGQNLWIIGNGFDIGHKIDTRYSDFKEESYTGSGTSVVGTRWYDIGTQKHSVGAGYVL